MRNYPEWMLAFTAVTSIGAVAVAMNAHWQADEMAYALNDCGAKVLFADQERLDRLAERAPMPGLQVLAVRADRLVAGARDLNALTAALGDVAMPPASTSRRTTWPSCSTPRAPPAIPRACRRRHRNVALGTAVVGARPAASATRVAGVAPTAPAQQPGTLLAVPLFHVTGLHASYLASYRQQRRMVCMYRWDAENAAELIERERLTSRDRPGRGHRRPGARRAGGKRHDLSSLLTVGGGGAPRAPEQVRQIDASFGKAMPNIGWGMTETNAIGAGIGGEDYLTHPESSGRCSQVLAAAVIDEQRPCAAQRAARRAAGARHLGLRRLLEPAARPTPRPSSTATGSAPATSPIIDDDGFVYIVDRIKDLIIRGGENIGCGAVEARAAEAPARCIEACGLRACPTSGSAKKSARRSTAPPRSTSTRCAEFLEAHLAKFEMPRYIVRRRSRWREHRPARS